MSNMNNQHARTIEYLTHEIEVYECWTGRREGNTDVFYDFYWNGECISIGVPLYASEVKEWDKNGRPSEDELRSHVEYCWREHCEELSERAEESNREER